MNQITRWLMTPPLGLMRHVWRDVGRQAPGSPVATPD